VAAFAMALGRPGHARDRRGDAGTGHIYRSASLGQAWTTFGIRRTGGGAMPSSLQFMSPTTGCLVTGNPGTGSRGQLLWTTHAGRPWSPVRF
jgi:hypothetical protein